MTTRLSPIPFTGEVMTCVLCGCQARSDPKISSNWRAVEIDGVRYYACTKEFPKDGSSAFAFKMAYERLLARIITLRNQPRDN